MTSLAGRVALVTGGSRNMGRAFVLGLARAGADVAILDLPGQRGASSAVAAEVVALGRRAVVVSVDISDEASVAVAVEAAAAELGLIRILVNNAARTSDDGAAFPAYPIDALDEQYRVTIRGTFLVAQAVARRLIAAKSGGAIVNVASRVAEQVQSGSLGYSIAKAAVLHMTRLLALDLAPDGIRVNAIGPGAVPRPGEGGAGPGPERFPLGRRLEYEDMVGAAVYLASDDAAMVTAQHLIVDGGLGLRPAY